MKTINVATVFSGIGSPEQALIRLNCPHKVLFACDNGEKEVELDYAKELAVIQSLGSPHEKMQYVNDLYSVNSRNSRMKSR
jgi:DNA (cytosine-5)-methyltransferase 1